MIKKAVKKSLASFGLQLYRTPRHLRAGKVTTLPVRVGRFEIGMPSNSQLPDLFATNPNYSSELGRLIEVVLRKYPNARLIDIGANCGDSVAIAKSVADIPVLCVEGDQHCLELLKDNTKQFTGVSIYQQFLGERTEAIGVVIEKKGWNTTIVPSQNGNSVALKLTSLDEFLATLESNLDSYKILKIDTEGFDCRIIRGGFNFIDRVKPAIAFEYNRDNMSRIGEQGLGTLASLRDRGYDVTLFYDSQGRLLLSTSLSHWSTVEDLHHYANGKNGAIYYYDICVFHGDDRDIALSFQTAERERVKLQDV